MKRNFFIGLILTSILVAGCKNDKGTETQDKDTQAKEAVTENFRVTINAVVKKNDDFQVYFIENATEDFSEEKSRWAQFKGSENAQDIVINLPAEIIPSSLRMDFGMNTEQDDIKINSVTMEYYGKKFTINSADFGKYFNLLSPTKMDFATGIMSAKDKEGKRVEPAIQAQETLNQEIAKMEK